MMVTVHSWAVCKYWRHMAVCRHQSEWGH